MGQPGPLTTELARKLPLEHTYVTTARPATTGLATSTQLLFVDVHQVFGLGEVGCQGGSNESPAARRFLNPAVERLRNQNCQLLVSF
jgi:hypothetical protein